MGGPEVRDIDCQDDDLNDFVSFDQLNLSYKKSISLRAIGSMRKPKLGFGRLGPALGITKSRNASVEHVNSAEEQVAFTNLPVLNNQHVRSSSESASRLQPRAHVRRPSEAADRFSNQSSVITRPKTAESSNSRKHSREIAGRRQPNMGPMSTEEKPLPLAIDVDNKKLSRTHIADQLAVQPVDQQQKPVVPDMSAYRTPRSSSRFWSGLEQTISTTHNRQVSESSIVSGAPTASTLQSSQSRVRSWSTSQATSPADTPTTSLHPSLRSSLYDNVELTLISTINELKELQGNWSAEYEGVAPGAQIARSSIRRSYDPAEWSCSEKGYFHPPSDTSTLAVDTLLTLPSTTFQPLGVAKSLPPKPIESENKPEAKCIQMETSETRLAAMAEKLAKIEAENAILSNTAIEAERNLQAALARLDVEAARKHELDNSSVTQNATSTDKHKIDSLEAELAFEKKKSHYLCGKLNEANTQRIELQERQYDARNDPTTTLSYDMPLNAKSEIDHRNQEIEELKGKLNKMVKKNSLLKHELMRLSSSPSSDAQSAVTSSDLSRKVEELQNQLAQRDSAIATLRSTQAESRKRTADAEIERQAKSVELQSLRSRVEALKAKLDTPNTASSSTTSLNDLTPTEHQRVQATDIQSLTAQLQASQRELASITTERDQFATLLRAEIRRVAIQEHNLAHPNSAVLRLRPDHAASITAVRERAQAHVAYAASTSDVTTVQSSHVAAYVNYPATASPDATTPGGVALGEVDAAQLAKEIEYYLQDIVLYKLDVRGYKKDLKRARERIRAYEAV